MKENEPTFINKRTRITKQQHKSRFLEAPLVRQADGELKHKHFLKSKKIK